MITLTNPGVYHVSVHLFTMSLCYTLAALEGGKYGEKGLRGVEERPPAALFSPMIPSRPGEGREGQGRWGGILFIPSQILNMGCVMFRSLSVPEKMKKQQSVLKSNQDS